jgi:hypothetical protein
MEYTAVPVQTNATVETIFVNTGISCGRIHKNRRIYELDQYTEASVVTIIDKIICFTIINWDNIQALKLIVKQLTICQGIKSWTCCIGIYNNYGNLIYLFKNLCISFICYILFVFFHILSTVLVSLSCDRILKTFTTDT